MKNDTHVVDANAVARRAYDLFIARGGEEGHALEDWLRAEAELQELEAEPPVGRRTAAAASERPSAHRKH
ncbi:MAG TPA: DUF2934 domain-containing protein [Polyangia bacterium]|jgi:hypothetical protein